MTNPRPHFSSYNPQLQVVWDSTSLTLLKECPRKYYFQQILMYRPKADALPLSFGIAYHAGLEEYDRALAAGLTSRLATHAAIRRALTLAQPTIVSRSDDNRRTLVTLVRSIIWYLEEFNPDPFRTLLLANGKPAVELSFKLQLDGTTSPDGDPYLLAGHLDRVVDFNGVWVTDRKTTTMSLGTSYFAQFMPNNQMSLYDFAGRSILVEEIQGVIVDAAQLLVGSTRFQREQVPTRQELSAEWLESTLETISLAERWAESHRWPINDTACNKYNGCPFREICSKHPAMRQMYFDANFVQQDWNPLEER